MTVNEVLIRETIEILENRIEELENSKFENILIRDRDEIEQNRLWVGNIPTFEESFLSDKSNIKTHRERWNKLVHVCCVDREYYDGLISEIREKIKKLKLELRRIENNKVKYVLGMYNISTTF